MLNYKTYVRVVLLLLITVFGGTFLYTFLYAKYYPIPLTHRISLDAKLMFIRDMPNRDDIDTIIVGSSIGLNNVQGAVLENSSQIIDHVINLSSFSMEVSHWEQIWELLTLFPNAKRVIYSTQSLDFTQGSQFSQFDLEFARQYTYLGKNSINLIYAFYAYKYFLQDLERHWIWQEKYMSNNKFTYIGFDRTGSAPLHIYGKDIIKRRWINPYVADTTEESYQALDRIVKKTQQYGMKFYLVLQPYRKPLVKKDKHLRDILEYFHNRAKKTVTTNGATVINLFDALPLDDKYFADRIHLNDQGSILTSEKIADFVDENELHKKTSMEPRNE